MTTRTVFCVQGLYGNGPSDPTRVWKDWLRDEFTTVAAAERASTYFKPDPKNTCWTQPSAKRIVQRTITEEVVS